MIGQTDSAGRSEGSSRVGGVPPANAAQHKQHQSTVYLSRTQVRQRYGGVTRVTIYRWVKNETLGFPKPITISTRDYWALSDLEAFERSKKAA